MSTASVDTAPIPSLECEGKREGAAVRSPAGRALVALVRLYQVARVGRVSPCRFTPTCSTYAIEAVERHGVLKGASLTTRRLGRCRPGGPSGYDPVPE